ncbi:preprotein translocase subunit TatA [Methylomonas lenta]|uniref:Sec-independent protein translocase protein TatA n=1 Tax=Methylomonas lenta TaxID=980561 RepID=A0A177MYJ2_9GAMM|nr:twin-arginine translocase TatA/TatE family subunit [Methylomonas lenta]OAI10363.1 preprotein translocase subunit TatA [Methylomonas lenta]
MGFSIPHLMVVLVIVLLVFGSKRLKNLGADLGGAINHFRKALQEADKTQKPTKHDDDLEHES